LKQDLHPTEFIIALTEHRVLGHVLAPFLVRKNEACTFYTIVSQVILSDIEKFDFEFSPTHKKIVQLTESYSDDNLARKFSRKLGSKEFFQNLDPNIFVKHISPFIDKQVVESLNLAKKNGLRLYHKPPKYSNVYDEDLIEILDKIARPVFNFDLTNEGLKYFLQIYYDDEPLKILFRKPVMVADTPCRMVINNKLYAFEKVSGKRLMPFLEKEFVKVPPTVTEKYLKTFVYNIVRDHDVVATGFDILTLDSDKKLIITIERGLDLEPMLVLRFQYATKRFLVDKKGDVEVDFKLENGKYVFRKYKRDLAWEKEMVDFLRTKGLVASGNRLTIAKDSDLFKDEPQFAIINWINRVKDEIREHNIFIEQQIFDIKYYTGLQDIKVDMKSEDDWFDLYAMVSFGDFKFPFIRLKKNILEGRREYLLPNGEVAILPLEWFAYFRELIPFAEGDGENLRFAKHHYKILEENLKGLDPKINEKVKDIENQTFELIPLPEGLKANLRSYQEEGFSWMYALGQKNFGGCLADDMGLGKTLQTLTLLLKLKSEMVETATEGNNIATSNQLSLFDQPVIGKPRPSSLVIVPTSLVYNWFNEAKKFAPQLKVHKYVGTKRKSVSNLQVIAYRYDVIITTYGTIRNDFSQMKDIIFNYLILDESQNIKNPDSKSYKAVCMLNSKHKLVLTGTPIENSLSDLWAQINFLNRDLLGSYSFFQKEFIQPIEKRNDEDKQRQLKNLITPFILRRKKEEVAKDLPALTELVRNCEMTEDQKLLYETQKSVIRNSLLENIEKRGIQKSSFLVLQGMTRLRQLSNHPALVGETASSSGKFNEVLSNLEELMSEKHKVLVFSSFVTHLKLFQDEFEKLGWQYCLLTGQTTDRESVINEFQNNPEKKIFLISLKAGGVGLNLTSADYIFILDPWWNPASENQAISRAHRIGQEKKVFVYRFISEETIEEKIQKLKERKSALAEKFIQPGSPFQSVSADEILDLFN
jgi:SNF2 family DNA or RNA helicase